MKRGSVDADTPPKPKRVQQQHGMVAEDHPHLVLQWAADNVLRPELVRSGSNVKIKWRCVDGHTWEAKVVHRTLRGSGCPQCHRADLAKKSVLFNNPQLAARWHPTRNSLGPGDVTCGSDKKVWLLCPEQNCTEGCLHEYEMQVYMATTRGCGCPFCSKPPKRYCIHNSLGYLWPELAAEWHPSNPRKATEYMSVSGKSVMWSCIDDPTHSWITSIANRVSGGTGCPHCKASRLEKAMTDVLQGAKAWSSPLWRVVKITFQDRTLLDRFVPDYVVTLRVSETSRDIPVIVEVDGVTHFKATWGPEALQRTVKRDRAKQALCAERNLPMLRLSLEVKPSDYQAELCDFFDAVAAGTMILRRVGQLYTAQDAIVLL